MVNTAATILLQYLCTGMVNTATIWYVKAWYISRITMECPTDSLLTTHAHYIREGFLLGQGKGIVGQLVALLSCTTLCILS